jgi:hypothetical protein
MRWGDVRLRQNRTVNEYLEYFEGQTKTRTGANPRDVRKVTSMFALPINSPGEDPVRNCIEKRPSEMSTDEAPFYLAINHCKKDLHSNNYWQQFNRQQSLTDNNLSSAFQA